MKYSELNNLNDSQKSTLISMFSGILTNVKSISLRKLPSLIKDIPSICEMHYNSYENMQKTKKHFQNLHPIKPSRGELYYAYITEGVGTELCGTHPVLIIQNQNSNLHSSKINVLPIEGDGNKIKPKYQEQITSEDLEGTASLIKNPSRVIISDIMTIDKSRLGGKIGKLNQDKLNTICEKLKQHLVL